MSQTGIVRKIDDLGRIVIPKEIRKTLRIREGDSFQIFVNSESVITLTRYEPMRSLMKISEGLVKLAENIMTCSICIADREKVIDSSRDIKSEYIDKNISLQLKQKVEDRMAWSTKQNTTINILERDNTKQYKSQYLVPIISNTDVIGAIIIFTKETGKIIADIEKRLAESIAKLLAEEYE